MDIYSELIDLGFKSIGGGISGRFINKDWVQYCEDENVISVFSYSEDKNSEPILIKENLVEFVKSKLGYFSIKGKVQTIPDGNNVLVESEVSTNTHHSGLDKHVTVVKVLDRREVEIEGEKILDKLRKGTDEDQAKLLKIYADLLQYQEGFAVCQCSTPQDKTEGILHSYGDIVKYEK